MSDKSKIRRRQRCPKCGSLDVNKWGIRNGVQRFGCTCTATTAFMFIGNCYHIPKYLWYFVGSNFLNIKMKTTVKNKVKDHCSSQLSIGNRLTQKLMK